MATSTTVPTDDYPADTSTTGALAVGKGLTATAENGYDHDWFKAGLDAGTTYQFTLYPMQLGGGYDGQNILSLSLRDGQGTALAAFASDRAYGALELQYTPTVSGAFYADVFTSNLRGSYFIGMNTAVPDAVPAGRDGAPPLAIGVRMDGARGHVPVGLFVL